MPKIILSCREELARELVPHVLVIGQALREGTAEVLGVQAGEVTFTIASYVAADNERAEFQILAIADPNPQQSAYLTAWQLRLATAWWGLGGKLPKDIARLVKSGKVEVQTQMPAEGSAGMYKEGKPVD